MVCAVLLVTVVGCSSGDDGAQPAPTVPASVAGTTPETTPATTPPTTATAAEPSGDIHSMLIDAGYSCGDVKPYEPVPGEMDLGVSPEATFACGDGVEVALMGDDLDKMLSVMDEMSCTFPDDIEVLTVGDGWFSSGDITAVDGTLRTPKCPN